MASLTSSSASNWRREWSRGWICAISGGETAGSAITGRIASGCWCLNRTHALGWADTRFSYTSIMRLEIQTPRRETASTVKQGELAGMTSTLQVMKFGGTSVGDATCIARTAQIIANVARQNPCVVVVSAMSGVTNRLIEAARKAATGDSNEGGNLTNVLRSQHAAALETLIQEPQERECVMQKLDGVLTEAKRLCDGTALLRELTPRTLDEISSLGERLSAPIVAAAVASLGLRCESVDATELIVTDAFHGGAEPHMERTRQKAQARLRPLLAKGVIPVVTGFIGATAEGKLTTLGRGGSDYSATILGAAMDASE